MNIESLFEKYNKDIYRYAYSITLNADEAKDTVSEVFSHLIVKDLSNVQNYKAYLLTTARNIIYRKYVKESKVTNLDESQEFPDIDTKPNEDTAIDSYLVEVIKNQLNSLDPSTREVILLKVWDDYKFSEIADITKEKESTVKLRYYRGLEKLKENINSSTKLKSVTLPIILFGLGKLLASFNYPKVPLVLSAAKGISALKIILGLIGIGTILVGSFFIAKDFLNNKTIISDPTISAPVSFSNSETPSKVIDYTLEIINGKDTSRQDQPYRALIYKTESVEKEIYRWLQYSEFGIGGANPCTEIKYNTDRSYFALCQMSAEVLSNQQIPLVFNQFGEMALDFSNVGSLPKDKLTSKTFGDTFFVSSALKDFFWIDRTNLKLSLYNKTSGIIEDSIYNISDITDARKVIEKHDWTNFDEPNLLWSGAEIKTVATHNDLVLSPNPKITNLSNEYYDINDYFPTQKAIYGNINLMKSDYPHLYFVINITGSFTNFKGGYNSDNDLTTLIVMVKEPINGWEIAGTTVTPDRGN